MTSLCSAHVRNLTYTLNWHGGEFASKSRRWTSTVESRFVWMLSYYICTCINEEELAMYQRCCDIVAWCYACATLEVVLFSIWVKFTIWRESRKSNDTFLWTADESTYQYHIWETNAIIVWQRMIGAVAIIARSQRPCQRVTLHTNSNSTH